MKPVTRIFASTLLIAAIAPVMVAQDVAQPSPAPPSSAVLGPQLIAWSALQRPQPLLTEPPSEPDRSENLEPQPNRAAIPPVPRKHLAASDSDAGEKDKIQVLQERGPVVEKTSRK